MTSSNFGYVKMWDTKWRYPKGSWICGTGTKKSSLATEIDQH